MKKSFMTRVLAVSLSAAMTLSLSTVSNLQTASAAAKYVQLQTTYKTLQKVGDKATIKLRNYSAKGWKIKTATSSDKSIVKAYLFKNPKNAAPYVKIKALGLGRARVTVTAYHKPTKKKTVYKKMKLTVQVGPKAGTTDTPTPGTPAEVAYDINSVTAVARNSVQVKFTKAVDAVTASNFTISGGSVALSVTSAVLDEAKTSAVLTLSDDMDWAADYELTVRNITVDGAAQAEKKVSFKALKQNDMYKSTLDAGKPALKANGIDTTTLTFTLRDINGEVIKDTDAMITFTSTYGNVSVPSKAVQDGVAEINLTSQYSAIDLYADVRAVVSSCRTNPELIGASAETTVLISPNPGIGEQETGAVLASVESNTADRVIAYFTSEVKPEWYLKTDAGRKVVDTNKVNITVYSGMLKSDATTNRVQTKVVGITELKDAAGERIPNALQLLVEKPLVDNTWVSVKFDDNRNNIIKTTSEKQFTLLDATVPSVLSVTNKNTDGKTSYRSLTIQFSEAVLTADAANANGMTDNSSVHASYASVTDATASSAVNNANYLIDGIPLDNTRVWGADAAATMEPDGINKDGEDRRYEVNITLGKINNRHVYLTPGKHLLQIQRVGDWAARSDANGNRIATDTFLFEVVEDNSEPTAKVDVQSPEQFKVTFDTGIELEPTAAVSQIKDAIILEEQTASGWTQLTKQRGNNDDLIVVTPIDNKTYVVELRQDWSYYYDTDSSKISYYSNKNFRLSIAKSSIYNIENGKTNSSQIDLRLDDDKMKNPDADVPEVLGVEQKNNKLYVVTMSEPVKLNATANGRDGLTPSQIQMRESNGVPTPTAEFVKEDATRRIVQASITTFADANYHMSFNVVPDSELESGDWRLYIRSVSDDYGNTMKTYSQVINIGDAPAAKFAIDWAVVDADGIYCDVSTTESADKMYGVAPGQITVPNKTGDDLSGSHIFVKFNQLISIGALNSALANNSFTVNNKEVTITSIDAYIKGYDQKANEEARGTRADSITINLSAPVSRTSVLNMVSAILSATGDTLNEQYIILPYQFGDSYPNVATDAVYGNNGSAEPVDTVARLRTAVNNRAYRVIKLTGNFSGTKDRQGNNETITIDRPLTLDLNGHTTTDLDLNFNFTAGGVIRITDTTVAADKAVFDGNITIDARYADCDTDTFRVTTENGNSLTVKALLSSTFRNRAKLADVKIEGSSAIRFINEVGGDIAGAMTINTSAKVTLDGLFDNVKVTNKATLAFADKDSQINNLTIAADVTIVLPAGATVVSDVISNVTPVGNVKADVKDASNKTVITITKDTQTGAEGLGDATSVGVELAEAEAQGAKYKNAVAAVEALEDAVNVVTLGAIKAAVAADKTDALYKAAGSIATVSGDALTAVTAISEGAYKTEYASLQSRLNAAHEKFQLKIAMANALNIQDSYRKGNTVMSGVTAPGADGTVTMSGSGTYVKEIKTGTSVTGIQVDDAATFTAETTTSVTVTCIWKTYMVVETITIKVTP